MKLFELIANYKCAHYIFASSGAVYNPNVSQHLEDDFRRGSDVYSSTKILAEDYLFVASKANGIPVTSLRFFNIVGPSDVTQHLVPDIVDQIMDNKDIIELGNLSTIRDYISVNDVCEVIEYVTNSLSEDLYSTLNVGTGVGYSGHQIFEYIVDLMGTNKTVVQDPKRVRASDRPSQIANTEKLQQKLGKNSFEPITKALSDYIDWRRLV